jgi:hypothetical protein
MNENIYGQGCYHIKDSVFIEGPAKFYYCNLSIIHQ